MPYLAKEEELHPSSQQLCVEQLEKGTKTAKKQQISCKVYCFGSIEFTSFNFLSILILHENFIAKKLKFEI